MNLIKFVEGHSGSIRVTIPKEIATQLELKGGDYADVSVSDSGLVIHITPVEFYVKGDKHCV